MGLIRKMTSISTLGVVSYRSKSERAAHVAKQTRNAARANIAQNQVLIDLQRQALEQERQAQMMRAAEVAAIQAAAERQEVERQIAGRQELQAVPAGYYPDPTDSTYLTYWDGQMWHPETKHCPLG